MPYRYEDLGDDDFFQRLCGALLTHLDNEVQVAALNQSDGGYDAFRRRPGQLLKVVGHQVKWTGNPAAVKDPVTWILGKLQGEKPKLKRMGSGGTSLYLVITNVASTARPQVGTQDRLGRELVKLGKEVGLTITVWWRGDLDARLDAAPRN